MNLSLTDPKLIVLVAVVILIIAVLASLYVRKTQEYHCRSAARVWARIRAGGAEAWVRTKSRSEISRSREAG
jgi:hypothetical protein